MKKTRIGLALTLALAGVLAAETAFAGPQHHRPRLSIGLHFGVPLAPFAYYYPPYYYYAPYYAAPIVVQQQPTVYVEQPAPLVQPQQPAGYWYYCADARAYYPYVKECPGGWQRVSPQPGN